MTDATLQLLAAVGGDITDIAVAWQQPPRPGRHAGATLTYPDLKAFAAACGQSRLNGGMHFGASVPASEDMCAGIGADIWDYASNTIL